MLYNLSQKLLLQIFSSLFDFSDTLKHLLNDVGPLLKVLSLKVSINIIYN